jgi:hypothetical protein
VDIRLGDGLTWVTHHGLDGVQNGINFGIGYPVKDVPPIPAVLDEPSLAQYRQLLRKVRLAETQVSFHVADTVLAVSQYREDRQPGGVGQHLE